MKKLLKITRNVIWIDHHVSAIEKLKGFEMLEGRRRIGMSGCLLTYSWLHPEIEGITSDAIENNPSVPLAVLHVNDWDVWRHKMKDTRAFITAFNACDYNLPSNLEGLSALLTSNIEVDNLIVKGETMLSFRDTFAKGYRDKYGFETTIKGYKAYALNIGNANSDYFGSLINDYDLVITFCYNGDCFTISLYSVKDNVDCSTIASQYEYNGIKGGGHKGASGFRTKELPFIKEEKKDE
jgi:oligoribonuclease NrnB/cAMP/cGMP phosphodiesterase (DHH superfamily)